VGRDLGVFFFVSLEWLQQLVAYYDMEGVQWTYFLTQKPISNRRCEFKLLIDKSVKSKYFSIKSIHFIYKWKRCWVLGPIYRRMCRFHYIPTFDISSVTLLKLPPPLPINIFFSSIANSNFFLFRLWKKKRKQKDEMKGLIIYKFTKMIIHYNIAWALGRYNSLWLPKNCHRIPHVATIHNKFFESIVTKYYGYMVIWISQIWL
jgi:hypothetical protein